MIAVRGRVHMLNFIPLCLSHLIGGVSHSWRGDQQRTAICELNVIVVRWGTVSEVSIASIRLSTAIYTDLTASLLSNGP